MSIERHSEFSAPVLPEEIVKNFRNINGELLAENILNVVTSKEYWGIFTIATPGSGKTDTNLFISKYCSEHEIPHLMVSYEHYLNLYTTQLNEYSETAIQGESDMNREQSQNFINFIAENVLEIHKQHPNLLLICEMPAGMNRHEPEMAVAQIISESRKSKNRGVCILGIEASDSVHKLSDTERENPNIVNKEKALRLKSSATASQSARAREIHNTHLAKIFEEATQNPQSNLIQYQQKSISIPSGMNVSPEEWERITRNLVATGEHWKNKLGRRDKLILAVNTRVDN